MLTELLSFDVRTIVGLLFWGNITSALLIFVYQGVSKSINDKEQLIILYRARFFKAIYFLFVFYRGVIPEFISFNISNTCFFIGMHMDGKIILHLCGVTSKKVYKTQKIILVSTIILMNVIDLVLNRSELRVAFISILLFFILLFPVCLLIRAKNITLYIKAAGFVHTLLMVILLPRAVDAYIKSTQILTNNIIESLTYLMSILIITISTPALLLILKENADIIMREMATKDSLTGISNRQSFIETVSLLYDKQKKANRKIAIIFLDIDYFKKVNDNYGHIFGDEVLVRFAKVIKSNIRSGDLSCRYGGEEFIIFLPYADENSVMKMGRRIAAEVDKLFFSLHPEFKFTISMGIYVGTPKDEETLESAINKADIAMYEAKKSGRNKIILYNPNSEEEK